MTASRRVATLFFLAAVCSSGAVACSRTPQACSDSSAGEAPIDPTLLAFLSRARAAHHLADIEEGRDLGAAVRALLDVVEGPIPKHLETPPAEAREVLADTEARIADLQSRQQIFEAAADRIDRALRWVPETSYFRGHLFETRGLVEQRWAEDLTRRGQVDAASAAKARALYAFETAMQIQAEVIRQAPSKAPAGVRSAPDATRAKPAPPSPPSSEETQP